MARLPSLRRHLVVLVLVTLAPLLAFAVWLVFRVNAQERALLEHGLEETAEALSTAVDREVDAVGDALHRLREAASGTSNVLFPLREALRQRATVGEVCHALRDVWGRYQPVERF